MLQPRPLSSIELLLDDALRSATRLQNCNMAMASSIVQDFWKMANVQHTTLSNCEIPVEAGGAATRPGRVAPQASIRAAGQATLYLVVLVQVSSPAQREDLLRLIKDANGSLPEQHCQEEQRHQQSSLHSAQAQIVRCRTTLEQRAVW